ncbi:hypothetical protein [Sorangium sp. So ce362]|uniref:hypothetical protein n=1 Tax=Sorangium sp. So ce362 TaxID=3133303 RepID=UPI003F5F0D2D
MRPRKGARRPPPAHYPKKRPPVQAIFVERPLIRAVLLASGVPARERADVEQQVLIGAWDSVRCSLYRPDPREDPRGALRGGIHGVTAPAPAR